MAFSKDFTKSIITNILNTDTFLPIYREVLIPEVFDNIIEQNIVNICLKFFDKYKRKPNYPELSYILDKRLKDLNEKELYSKYIDVIKKSEVTDTSFIMDEVIEFSKIKNIQKTILQTSKELENPNVNSEILKASLEETLTFGNIIENKKEIEFNEGGFLEWIKSFEDQKIIKTGFRFIDDSIDKGGLSPGDMILIIAPPGKGKSAFLVDLAVKALLNDQDVYYFTLELNKDEIFSRVVTNIFGADIRFIKRNLKNISSEVLDKIKELNNKIKNSLTIIQYPSKRASISTLENRIRNTKGKRPSVVVVDHAKILKPLDYKDSRASVGYIPSELRGLAGELEFVCLSAWHSNRSSWDKELIDNSDIADASLPIEDMDITITLTQGEDEKDANLIRAFIDKNRLGTSSEPTTLRITPTFMFLEE